MTRKPEDIADTELDAISGGPLEIRELTVRVVVDETDSTASQDMVLKGKKILEN